MFIVSFKMTAAKTLCIIFAAICIGASAAILKTYSGISKETAAEIENIKSDHYLSGKTNNERLNFLEGFGWEVEEIPENVEEVKLPREPDEIMKKYNEIQKQQGFDMSSYYGKNVKRYTYIVTNYPQKPEGIRAHVFTYKGKIVGGDVCSLEIDGFLHSFNIN